LKFISDMF